MSATRHRVWIVPLSLAMIAATASQAAAQSGAFDPLPPARSTPSRPVAPPTADAIGPMARPTPPPDHRITIELRDGSLLIGELAEIESFKVETSYGDLTVPAKSIAGIRFGDYPVGGDEHAGIILFENGDLLSGRLALPSVKLDAKWGKADVSPQQMRSIMMTADRMIWVNDGRWKLVPAGEVPTPGSQPVYRAPSYPTPATSYAPTTPGTAPSPYAPGPLPPALPPTTR